MGVRGEQGRGVYQSGTSDSLLGAGYLSTNSIIQAGKAAD